MRASSRGFTLIEVVIALGILAVNLTALLLVMSASYDHAYRARDYSVAALLARSKMVDIEQYLFDEGFKQGEETDSGTFAEEGYEKVKWEYRIFEIDLDLGGLGGLCGGFSSEEDQVSDCESMLSGVGGPFEALATEVADAVRMVELTVTWPVPPKYEQSMKVTALVTREDFKPPTGILPSATPGGTSGTSGGTSGGKSGGKSGGTSDKSSRTSKDK